MTSNSRMRPPPAADEREMLSGWLDWLRATVHVKCEGLADSDAHRAYLPSSPLVTIGGVVSHLTATERGWFVGSFLGERSAEDESADPLADWRGGAAPLGRLLDDYSTQCDRSREIVAAHDLDELEAFAPPGLPIVSLRWIVTHMIEETARHLGHLDAIRELTDGVRGQ